MECVCAKDIMHPRMSLPLKTKGTDLVNKLTCMYPALPVVNEKDQVVGIVSEYDVLDAVREGRTIHEFSAESLMSCGHIEHEGSCTQPITITPDTPVEDIVEIFYGQRISVLPVVDDGLGLVGLIARKNLIDAMAEVGFWKDVEFKKRVTSKTARD